MADNPYKHQQGLMFRKEIPDDYGMFFKFSKPQVLKFWGLNTFIPLDIAFIDDDMKIIKIDRIKPNSMISVSSDKQCQHALEVNLGFFNNNNISVGHRVRLQDIDQIDFKYLLHFGDQE